MTATQLALGIFFGFGGLEVFKVVVATIYDNHKRSAMRRELTGVATDFIDKMHDEIEADRAAEEAKKARRRKPATQGKGKIKGAAVKKAPARKSVAKKAGK